MKQPKLDLVKELKDAKMKVYEILNSARDETEKTRMGILVISLSNIVTIQKILKAKR
jgi:hypothetical protein